MNGSILFLEFPKWLNPEIIPGLPFRWYGLMYLLAFITAYLLFQHQAKEQNLQATDDDILNFFFYIILGLLLGARILSTLVYDVSGRYWRNPLLIFWPFDDDFRFTGFQGMSYHGGLIGAVAAMLIFCKAKKISILTWGDLLAVSVPLGYSFGRIGNFINGELYGRVTTAPWGMIFPFATPFATSEKWVQQYIHNTGFPDSGGSYINLPRHPSQLYETFFEGIGIWLILWFGFRKKRPFPGFLIALYLILYGTVRFVIEYFREPDRELGYSIVLDPRNQEPYLLGSLLNFTTGQVLCAIMIVAGGISLLLFYRLHLKKRLTENNSNGQ